MDDNTKLKLQMEQAKGAEYQQSYQAMVKPFIDAKKAELFAAFQELPTTDSDALMAIKMQCNAMQSLDDEFQHYITTGQLAQKSLQTEEDKENANG